MKFLVKNRPCGSLGQGLYEGLRFDPSWTAEEICDHFRKLTKKYFVSRFLVRESLEKVIISSPVAAILNFLVPQFKTRHESILNFQVVRHDEEEIVNGKKERNGLMALITGQTAVKTTIILSPALGPPFTVPIRSLRLNGNTAPAPIGAPTCILRGGASGAKEQREMLPSGF